VCDGTEARALCTSEVRRKAERDLGYKPGFRAPQSRREAQACVYVRTSIGRGPHVRRTFSCSKRGKKRTSPSPFSDSTAAPSTGVGRDGGTFKTRLQRSQCSQRGWAEAAVTATIRLSQVQQRRFLTAGSCTSFCWLRQRFLYIPEATCDVLCKRRLEITDIP
jgi:hypothetical protein